MLFSINREDAEVSDLCPSFDYDECILYNLQYEIDYFNSIIKWDGMWDLPKAKIRLDNGWKFVVFNPQSIIQGWGWLNTETKEICNIYVNPKYRYKGIGGEIVNSLHRYCQDWDSWWAQSDSWNKSAQKMFLNINYKSNL